MSTVRRLVSIAFDALGDTADDVADFLTVGGWTGLRHDPSTCPVAVYLKAIVPSTAVVAVSAYGTSVLTDNEHVHIPTPPGPAEFITAFDEGAYDELAAYDTDVSGEVVDDLER